MARSLNKIQIIGYCQPEDPQLKETQNGRQFVNFKLVTDESYKDKDGNKVDKAEWHRVVFWGKPAEIIGQYLKKGGRIYIEGRIQTRSWEDNGETKYITEINGSDFLFLGGLGGPKGEEDNGNGETTKAESGSKLTTSTPVGAATTDDDLPF